MKEEDFQQSNLDQSSLGSFLSEAMITDDKTTRSPFTEMVILATICGRILAHRQQAVVENVYNSVPQDFRDRHSWLNKMLETRIDLLVMNYPSTFDSDCLLLFTKMLAQATVLYLCKSMEMMKWDTEEGKATASTYKQRSLRAAQQIVSLSRSLAELSFLKVSIDADPLKCRDHDSLYNTGSPLHTSAAHLVQRIRGEPPVFTYLNKLHGQRAPKSAVGTTCACERTCTMLLNHDTLKPSMLSLPALPLSQECAVPSSTCTQCRPTSHWFNQECRDLAKARVFLQQSSTRLVT